MKNLLMELTENELKDTENDLGNNDLIKLCLYCFTYLNSEGFCNFLSNR